MSWKRSTKVSDECRLLYTCARATHAHGLWRTRLPVGHVCLSMNNCAGKTDFLPTGTFFAQRMRELNTTNATTSDERASAEPDTSGKISAQVQAELRVLREQNAAMSKTLDMLVDMLRGGTGVASARGVLGHRSHTRDAGGIASRTITSHPLSNSNPLDNV